MNVLQLLNLCQKQQLYLLLDNHLLKPLERLQICYNYYLLPDNHCIHKLYYLKLKHLDNQFFQRLNARTCAISILWSIEAIVHQTIDGGSSHMHTGIGRCIIDEYNVFLKAGTWHAPAKRSESFPQAWMI